jgi:O-methyltransferase
MAGHMRKKGIAKRIYACDSFEGFDPTELRREKDSGLTDTPDDAFTSTSLHYVRAKIAKLGFSDVIQPVQGFFQNTLPHLDVSICMALVDCDLQDSLVYAAEALWPRIVAGGRLLFDDYTSTEYQGAKKGVDLFTKKYAGEIQSHGLLNQLYFVHKK